MRVPSNELMNYSHQCFYLWEHRKNDKFYISEKFLRCWHEFEICQTKIHRFGYGGIRNYNKTPLKDPRPLN